MKFYIPYILIVDRLRNSLSLLLAPHNKPIKPTLSTLRYASFARLLGDLRRRS